MNQHPVIANLDIKNNTYSAPTPQNTPVNAAPITSSYQPTFNSISETMETQGTLLGRAAEHIQTLPTSVQRRIHGLKYFQSQHAELEGKFQEEVLALEKKYLALYQPLYNKRSEVITGKYEPTAEEVALGEKAGAEEQQQEDSDSDNKKEQAETKKDTDNDDDVVVNGIPEFWLTALKNHPQIGESIADQDEAALKHLVDIRMQYMEKPGFQIEFEFSENDFFSNKVLTKAYYYQEHAYGGDFVYDHAQGCEVQWKEGKDLTVTIETKKQRHKGTNKTRVVKRTVPSDSFFHFFSPPVFPDESEELDEEEAEGLDAKLEADYEMGEEFKDKIIPHAVDYFTGKALEYEDFDGDDDFEDDFYDDISEEDDEEDDEEEDDDDDDTQPAKGENAPECKQS
ncbi:nucleosome assembly protein-domain-containing protein [Chlamydoabsidia padenii]|nr:nucleosome assembly protein-domain-containing protein [Chlamydoabsidia padenii]